jgi:hypothetical protein
MQKKRCSKCGKRKALIDFHRDGRLKSGVRADCKQCVIERRSQYRADNAVKVREQKRQHYRRNRDEIRAKQKAYYDENVQQILAHKRKYMRRKWRDDPCWRLRKIVGTAVYEAIRQRGGSKAGQSVTKHLPYSAEELVQHLEAQFEPWMSWDNWGKPKQAGQRTWEIDHIIPQSELPYDSFEHPNFMKCWALSNLRPLDARANLERRYGNHKH